MRPLERVPAVRRIDTDRADFLAVDITGEFTAADAENLCGLLEGAYALHERIDLLVRLIDLESVETSDLSPETVAFIRDHVARHVGRCAVIDPGGWGPQLTSLISSGTGAEMRLFPGEEEPEAWQWLGAHEIAQKL